MIETAAQIFPFILGVLGMTWVIVGNLNDNTRNVVYGIALLICAILIALGNLASLQLQILSHMKGF